MMPIKTIIENGKTVFLRMSHHLELSQVQRLFEEFQGCSQLHFISDFFSNCSIEKALNQLDGNKQHSV